MWKSRNQTPLQKGRSCYENGEYDQAIESLSEALDVEGDDDKLLCQYFLGQSWFEKGNYKKALVHLNKALEISKGQPILKEDSTSFYCSLSRSHAMTFDYSNALKYAEQIGYKLKE